MKQERDRKHPMNCILWPGEILATFAKRFMRYAYKRTDFGD